VRRADVDALIDGIAGDTLTAFVEPAYAVRAAWRSCDRRNIGGSCSRCAPRWSTSASSADKCGESPLDDDA